MTATPSIVCAGYMPLDIIQSQEHTIGRRVGGTAANVASIMAFLGWQATLAGQAGADAAGDELIADLHASGVDIGQVNRNASARTARLIHDIRPEGHGYRYRCGACGSRFPRSLPLTLEGARACAEASPRPTVYFFDRANPGTLALAETYAAQGAVVIFEPSVPVNAELLQRATEVARVIKHSDDRSIGGLEDLNVTPSPGQVRIVTHGAEGLELRIGRARGRRLPAFATLAVDTGGAGDWTTAGFVSQAIVRGELNPDKLESALRFGQALAAVNCAMVGARGLSALSPSSARRRARRVLLEGSLGSPPRVGRSDPPTGPPGLCLTCLMPICEQLEFDGISTDIPAAAHSLRMAEASTG